MKASIIIPTRNRSAILAQCLSSLTAQTASTHTFEVLVVDNGSSDDTHEIAKQFMSSLQLHYINAPEPGLHVARHAGMRKAQSNILMFADDDIVAGTTWIESVVQAFVGPDVALVGGNNRPMFEAPPPAWLLQWWQRPAYKGRALPYLSILDFGIGSFEIDPAYVWGCNFSVRRDVLLASGGFHPDAVPKDRLRYRGDGETYVSDVVRRSGLRALFDSAASVQHRVPSERMTPAYFAQRAYAQGISDSFTDIRSSCGVHISRKLRMQRRLTAWRNMLNRWAPSVPVSADGTNLELRKIRYDVGRAWWDGYRFHQQEAYEDLDLLAWVLRDNYM